MNPKTNAYYKLKYRLFEEQRQLVVKIGNAVAFLNGARQRKVSPEALELLRDQLEVMHEYVTILDKRISLVSSDIKQASDYETSSA